MADLLMRSKPDVIKAVYDATHELWRGTFAAGILGYYGLDAGKAWPLLRRLEPKRAANPRWRWGVAIAALDRNANRPRGALSRLVQSGFLDRKFLLKHRHVVHRLLMVWGLTSGQGTTGWAAEILGFLRVVFDSPGEAAHFLLSPPPRDYGENGLYKSVRADVLREIIANRSRPLNPDARSRVVGRTLTHAYTRRPPLNGQNHGDVRAYFEALFPGHVHAMNKRGYTPIQRAHKDQWQPLANAGANTLRKNAQGRYFFARGNNHSANESDGSAGLYSSGKSGG